MTRKVLIAGGGTGGHLFPGIALAKALRKSDMTIEILFVGTKKGIESKVLPKEGFRLKTIISAGLLGKKGLDKWISLLKLMVGGVQSIGFLICNRCLFKMLLDIPCDINLVAAISKSNFVSILGKTLGFIFS